MKIKSLYFLLLILLPTLSNGMECPYETTEEYLIGSENIYLGTVMSGTYSEKSSFINYEIKISKLLKGGQDKNRKVKGVLGNHLPLEISANVIIFESRGIIISCSPSGTFDLTWANTNRADIHPDKIVFAKKVVRYFENYHNRVAGGL